MGRATQEDPETRTRLRPRSKPQRGAQLGRDWGSEGAGGGRGHMWEGVLCGRGLRPAGVRT